MTSFTPANPDVLLVPMQPTPNGRLHIGHGAGTYLRADVIARALRAQGHRVAVVSGSDAYEDWVVATAEREGRTPQDTSRDYHIGIGQDLDHLGVALNAWINPLSEEHCGPYQVLHQNVLDRLRATGVARLESERIPYSQTTGRPLVGPWIAGFCPNCGQSSGGSTCTNCGEYFRPEQVVTPRSRLDDAPIVWRTEQNWFATAIDPGAVVERHRTTGPRSIFQAPVARAIAANGGYVRLTGQGSWGVRGTDLPPGKVISNSYFVYSLYCGEVYRALTHSACNPFAPGSGVTTVALFGSDNSIPGLVCPDVIAQGSRGMFNPFDAAVVNGMLYLEGQKCSTSKQHGIWLKDIFKSTSITSDELRYALSPAPLDHGPADIAVTDVVERVSALRAWHHQALDPVVHRVRTGKSSGRRGCGWDSVLTTTRDHYAHLGPYAPDLAAAMTTLADWMRRPLHSDLDWLTGLSLLAWPFSAYPGEPTVVPTRLRRGAILDDGPVWPCPSRARHHSSPGQTLSH